MKKRGWLMKISILSISLLTTSAAANASAIPLIQESFPEQSLTSVEMLTMLPTAMVALFVLLSIPISRWIGARKTVMAGLLITLISGVLPVIVNDFTIILISRACLGIGIGLFNGFAYSLINDFYEGEERAQTLGYQSSFQGIGGAFLTFLAGQLLVISWHMSFSVFLIVIPVFFLFFMNVPEPPAQDVKEKAHFVKGMIKYIVLLFITMTFYNAIVIKLPNLFVTRGIGDASMSSLVFTLVQLASMAAGFAFGSLFKFLKRNTLPFAIVLMGIGFCILAFSNSLALAIVGSVLTGISFATYLPYLFNQAAAISPGASGQLSSNLLIVFGQFSGFTSPYLLAPLQSINILGNEFASCFLVCGILLIVESVVILLIQQKRATS